MKLKTKKEKKVTTALLLAAGTGSRLFPLTQEEPKCLTMVNGKSILERLISNLRTHGFKRLVVVTGHLEGRIREELGNSRGSLKIEYVHSPLYKTTNNIYSLWKVRKHLKEPFVLFESDLVFDESLLAGMVYPNRIAVADRKSWMDGTCVSVSEAGRVNSFVMGDDYVPDQSTYKTVNIYSLSSASWKTVSRRLDAVIAEGHVNSYYETVFSDLVEEGSLSLHKVSFDRKPWYEIDTIEDLREAEKLFPTPRSTGAVSSTKKNPVLKVLSVASTTEAASGI